MEQTAEDLEAERPLVQLLERLLATVTVPNQGFASDIFSFIFLIPFPTKVKIELRGGARLGGGQPGGGRGDGEHGQHQSDHNHYCDDDGDDDDDDGDDDDDDDDDDDINVEHNQTNAM